MSDLEGEHESQRNEEVEEKETTPVDATNENSDDDVDALVQEITEKYRSLEAPPEEEVPKPQELTPAQKLAARLRQNAQNARQQKPTVTFQADLVLSSDRSPERPGPGLRVLPGKVQYRELLKRDLRRRHGQSISEEMNEVGDQEMADEEYEEEEEEEDAPEMKGDIAKATIEELKKENPAETEVSQEELEKRLYEKVVEMRLSEDMEEIKKIIRIITGQWRSGRLRLFADGQEGIDKAFEGNEKEKKDLAQKKQMRKQRRVRQKEERERRLTSDSITQMIERAMWVKAGTDENASASDVLRGQLAMMSDRDPRKEVLERLEMNAFLQEQRAKEALKERRFANAHKLKRVARTESGELSDELKVRPSDVSRKSGTFSFVVKDRNEQREQPRKKVIPKRVSTSEELASFLSKIDE